MFPIWEQMKKNRKFVQMKNIVSVKTLKEHWEKTGRGDSEAQLKVWYQEVKKSNWKSPNEVKQIYRSASIIGENRIVFNICGNKYRLIVKINYESQWVFIRFVGTHEEYDKIDAETI